MATLAGNNEVGRLLAAAALLVVAALLDCARPTLVRAQHGAQPGPNFGADAHVERSIAATHDDDATASATEVEMERRLGAADTVSDVLMDIPGARPFRTGTLGSFTSASLRGAQTQHTAVLFGDLPIGGADGGAFNLSTIPASVLERVIAYRGGAPVWVSQGAIGGVLQLVPREAQGSELSVTGRAGSFGLRGLDLSAATVPDNPRAPRLLGAAGVTESDGDFDYRFDNKTSFIESDDYTAGRRNADALDGHAMLHLTQPAGPGHFDLVALGFERVAGEPGSPADPLQFVRRNVVRGIGAVGYTLEHGPHAHRDYRLQTVVGGSYQRIRISDPSGELGMYGPGRSDARQAHGFGRLAASAALSPWLEGTAIASGRRDRFAQDISGRLIVPPKSTRNSATGAAELRIHGRLFNGLRGELRPSVRLALTEASLGSERFGDVVRTQTDTRAATYRAAGALELLPGLGLSASAASGARVPSTLELFGDGATLVGNTDLRNERSESYDLGATLSGQLGVVVGTMELRGFALSLSDQIVFVRAAENELVPLNQASSEITGIEWGTQLDITRYLRWTSALTLLETEGKPGKKLINRPRAVIHARPEAHLFGVAGSDELVLFGELNIISASYDDPDNVGLPKPSQHFFDSGLLLTVLRRRLELRVTARNLGDVRSSDIRGFQLPGRTLWASLTYRETE